jgi:hypothetical protein
MLRQRVFDGAQPPVAEVIVDVDISTLGENHVLPNIGSTVARGVCGSLLGSVCHNHLSLWPRDMEVFE